MWLNLAAGYDKAPGQRDRAPEAYRKAMELAEQERALDPNDGRLVIDMADCAGMLGDKPRALALTAEALKLAPEQSEVQYMAADIYETLGDRTSALQCLERALRAGYQRTLLEDVAELREAQDRSALQGAHRITAGRAGEGEMIRTGRGMEDGTGIPESEAEKE